MCYVLCACVYMIMYKKVHIFKARNEAVFPLLLMLTTPSVRL